MAYSVDEVSALLDVPRPTLYRYLREYSIPHVRVTGRISIPEESFERIREARELHREGLGTESVRRRLRREAVSVEELKERLDSLAEALKDLRDDLRLANESFSPQTMRTLLTRQSLLNSSVQALTEMIKGGRSESARDGNEEIELREMVGENGEALGRLGERLGAIEERVEANASATDALLEAMESLAGLARSAIHVAMLDKNGARAEALSRTMEQAAGMSGGQNPTRRR